jgi:hypothetical protein
LELRAAVTPPVPAVPLRLTVHVLELPGPSVFGVQLRPLIVNCATPLTAIEPPVGVTETPSPARDAPNALVSPSVEAPVAAADMVTETVATMPL